MRLYPEHKTITQQDMDIMSRFKYKEDAVHLLYATSGIIQVHKNKLNRLKVVDMPTKQISIGNHSFLLDESKYVVDCEWFQIPRDHLEEQTIKTYYRIRPGALVELVVERNTTVVSGESRHTTYLVYFNVNNVALSHGEEEDIVSLLETLKSDSS